MDVATFFVRKLPIPDGWVVHPLWYDECQIQRFNFDCNLVVTRKVVLLMRYFLSVHLAVQFQFFLSFSGYMRPGRRASYTYKHALQKYTDSNIPEDRLRS